MPLSLAGAINLNMAVLIFIGVIKDTEVDVGLRTEFGRKSTLDEAGCIGNCDLRCFLVSSSFALTNN